MTLRHKFGSLAFVYLVALTVNMVLCLWGLLVYYNSLLAGFAVPDASTEPTEARILQILMLNTLCGLGLALLGLRLAQRWVNRPVADLREAAAQIGRGNWGHRIRVRSRDELGLLAGEVNEMAATVADMQRRLVEQEKRAVATQTVRCVVHNIRSPLTGIRWLAEAIAMRPDAPPPVAQGQARIVEVVDQALGWLQRFRDALSKASLNIEPVRIADLVAQIVESSPARAEDETTRIRTLVSPDLGEVRVDRAQFRSALEALLAWAVAVRPSGPVNLTAQRTGSGQAAWRLTLATGPREPLSEGEQASGGMGELAMAERVIQFHGGQFELNRGPDSSRLTITLPA